MAKSKNDKMADSEKMGSFEKKGMKPEMKKDMKKDIKSKKK
jgi:hypothetical protein